MKKAFTLIELIIVIGILSLLIGSISFFVPTQQDKKIQFGQDCSNYIFQEIINEQNNIEKNKIIRSGDIILNPTETVIKKNDGTNDILTTNYYNEEQIYKKTLINDKGSCLNDRINHQNKFIIYLDNIEISLKKHKTSFQKEINIKACELNNEGCMDISKITYNKTNNKFEQKFCLSLSGNNCSIWEE